MGKVDELAALQKELQDQSDKTRRLREQYRTRTAGESPDSLVSRTRELARQISEVQITVEEGDHGPFTDEHQAEYLDDRVRFKHIDGCPDCEFIDEKYGRAELRREYRRLSERLADIKVAYDQLTASNARQADLISRFKALVTGLELPGFEEVSRGAGNISITVQRLRNHRLPLGQGIVIDNGYRVAYRGGGQEASVIFDMDDKLWAHQAFDGVWRLFGLGPRQLQSKDAEASVKIRGGFDFKRQVPTTDIIIAYRDGSGEHEHIILDDLGNVIFRERRKDTKR